MTENTFEKNLLYHRWRHFPNLFQKRPISISSQQVSLKALKDVPRLIWGV